MQTEEIGTSVLGEMVGQRRQLEGIRDNVKLSVSAIPFTSIARAQLDRLIW